jgi:hypothetical protein
MDDLPENLKDAPEWIKSAERQARQRRLKAQQALKKQEQLEKSNLNQAYVRADTEYMEFYGPGIGVVADYSTVGEDQKTCVYFKNIEKHLIDHIQDSEVVVGCVAWLTNEQILKALAQKRGVSLIVQKEDFLRPDITSENNWPSRLRQWYNSLPKTLDRRDFYTTVLGGMDDRKIDQLIDPVRCVGNYNASRQSAFPRSHHKFVLFCKYIMNCDCKSCQEYKNAYLSEDYPVYGDKKRKDHIRPYAVWTGSFNFTKSAALSFENAVVLQDAKIVEAYFQEYSQIAALSEPLDWTATWIAPQWTFQTTT